MNSLIVDFEAAILAQRVMKEYIEVIDTKQPYDKYFGAYVPSPVDLVNAFPGEPWDDASVKIAKVVYQNTIFIRFDKEYFNIPVVEVW